MQKYLVDEFVDDYKEGELSRRDLIKRISLITGVTVTAATLAQLGVPDEVRAVEKPLSRAPLQLVAPDDPEIAPQMVTFPGPDGAELSGYFVRPAADGTYAGVVVVSDNRALSEHMMDVTRRAAKAGFAAVCVDLVSREGGTARIAAEDPSRVSGLLGAAPRERHVGDENAAAAYLQIRPDVRPGGVGIVGFCFGGGIAWLAALSNPQIKAAAPWYGPVPPLELIPNLAGPVALFYGQEDRDINPGIPGLVTALMEAQKVWSMHVYAGAGHAFNSDDRPSSYRPAAAADAWAKTIELFTSALPQA